MDECRQSGVQRCSEENLWDLCQCNAMRPMPCDAMQYNVMQCSAVQYNTIQCKYTIHYNTVQ